jgi:S-formylglutathione hydrolase FrmB
VKLRMQEGGHDYYFISTFIDDHIRHASAAIKAAGAAAGAAAKK